MLTRVLVFGLLAGAWLPSAACSEGDGHLTVFAAVSLRASLERLAETFEEADVRFSFAGSQQLRFQLEQGARAGVFVAADQVEMDRAREAGLIEGEPAVFARNRLAVAVSEEARERVRSLEDLALPEVRVVLAGEQAPLGRYSRQAIEALDSRLGGAFAEPVSDNVVSEEENAEAVVAKVELGEADAAIVYLSDAERLRRAGAAVIEIDDAYQPRIEYHAAVLRDAGRPEAARAFARYLLSAEAQAVLRDAGLLPIR